MRRALVVLGCVAVAACGILKPPPAPWPTPTPGPTPTPPTTLPPKTQPLGPERLLRNEANKHLRTNDGKRFDPFGAIPCCDAWRKVPNQRWPLASEGFMDETGKYGANLYHFRIGPWYGSAEYESEWSDLGGAYNADGSWNEAYWTKVRELVWHAYQRGAFVEVVPVDDWWLKGACGKDRSCGKQVPWTQAAVEAWGKRPHPEAEALIRKTVEELGNFGNVIWATGNEEDLIPGVTTEHVNWRIAVIRDAETDTTGAFVHLVGSGSWKPGIHADYTITHDRAPVTGPCGPNGTLCANNEHNPEFSPEEEASRFNQARRAGQRWDAWRAGANDADWERRLELFKGVVDGSTPVGCFPPASDDPKWGEPVPGPGFKRAAVQAAQAAVGQRCGTDHDGSIATLDMLGTQLRKAGECAGRLDDAVFVLAEDGQWEEYHAVRFTDGCWSQDPGQYPKLRWPYHGTNPQPVCTNPNPQPVSKWNLKIHNVGPQWTTLDATPLVCDAAYCAAIGFTDGRSCCPVRQEGDPARAACEAVVVGVPIWAGPPAGRVHPDNPYLWQQLRGTGGTVTVCAQPQPRVCASIEVAP